MDWQAIWETIKLLRYIVKLHKWWEWLVYVTNFYFRKPVNVIVYGTTGAGKTEFIRALLEQEVDLMNPPRTRFFEGKRLVLNNGRKIKFFDVPGHSSLKQQRQTVAEKIVKRKIKGIINVTTYGYNDVEEAEDVAIFKIDNPGIPVVKNDYLKKNRQRELEQIREWENYITSYNKIKWLITVVNKADIWNKNKKDVLDYYQSGLYYDNFIKTIERVCKTCVFPYCSIISPFANQPMELSFSERDKIKMHHELKSVILKLVKGKYEK